jgi:hypothetical protein
MKLNELITAVSLPPLILGLAMTLSLGCENKEKILDVETPGANIEVERNRDTGEVDVDATDKDKQILDSDVPGADVEVERDKATGDVEVK